MRSLSLCPYLLVYFSAYPSFASFFTAYIFDKDPGVKIMDKQEFIDNFPSILTGKAPRSTHLSNTDLRIGAALVMVCLDRSFNVSKPDAFERFITARTRAFYKTFSQNCENPPIDKELLKNIAMYLREFPKFKRMLLQVVISSRVDEKLTRAVLTILSKNGMTTLEWMEDFTRTRHTMAHLVGAVIDEMKAFLKVYDQLKAKYASAFDFLKALQIESSDLLLKNYKNLAACAVKYQKALQPHSTTINDYVVQPPDIRGIEDLALEDLNIAGSKTYNSITSDLNDDQIAFLQTIGINITKDAAQTRLRDFITNQQVQP